MARRCPVDENVLVTSLRDEVEVDACPACGGVWLDRGELEKIVAPIGSSEFEESTQPHGGHEIGHQRKGFLGWLFDV